MAELDDASLSHVEAGGLLPRAQRLTSFHPPHRFTLHDHFKALMHEAQAHEASDVFIVPGLPVTARISGDMMALTPSPLDTAEVMNIVKWAAGRDTAETDVISGQPVNGRYELFSPTEKDFRGAKRRYGYRLNISPVQYAGSTSAQVVMRGIPSTPPKFDTLGLTEGLVRDCIPRDGIVYVAGATGSGKTTTFASIIRYILENDTPIKGNLITHEEPIEFVFDQINSRHSIIVQSEIPHHFNDFYAANREAMRRKPGFILIGEMRDESTIRAGIELALTGHPVYATVHATDVASVMRRLISRFPVTDRATAIYDIVDTSRFVMAQRLVKGVDGRLLAVREYLKFDEEISEKLSNLDDMGKVTSVVKKLVELHGHSFRTEARSLLDRGLITRAVADSIWPPAKEVQLQELLADEALPG